MTRRLPLIVLVALLLASLVSFGRMGAEREVRLPERLRPAVPELRYSPLRTAPLEVARVFGRTPGCADTDTDLIEAVARAAVRAGLDARTFAALVAVESGCDQYAVSPRGAIGYTQVVPRVWKGRYDLAEQYNLFNPRDNLRVGATILADLERQHGPREGLRRYNGTGQGCPTCDAGYAARITALAGTARR